MEKWLLLVKRSQFQPSVTTCSAVSAVPVNIADNLKKVEASWSINPAVVEIQDPPNEQLGSTR